MHFNVKKITRMLLECQFSITGRSSSYPTLTLIAPLPALVLYLKAKEFLIF